MAKKKVSFEIDEILPYFDALEDPRSPINQLHPLVSVVVISQMGVLAGANGSTAIARWANNPVKHYGHDVIVQIAPIRKHPLDVVPRVGIDPQESLQPEAECDLVAR